MNEMVYLAEKSSEHPIGKAVCQSIENIFPSEIQSINDRYSVYNFYNRNGEGIVATIGKKGSTETYEIMVGNQKLMKSN